MTILYTETKSIPRTDNTTMVQATMTNPVQGPLQYLVLGVMGFFGSQQACVWFNTCVEPGLDASGEIVPRDNTDGAARGVLNASTSRMN